MLIQEWCSSTSITLCPDQTTLVFQIVSGFSNLGYVLGAPTNFFQFTTLTNDALYTIDTVSSISATPSLTAAPISISSFVFSSNQAATSNVTLDIPVKFGARVYPGNFIVLNITDEIFRSDNGAFNCYIVLGSVETALNITYSVSR